MLLECFPSRWLSKGAALALLMNAVLPAIAGEEQKLASRADLEQKLGAQIPLDLIFTDDTGQRVSLRSYFGQRPVILQLGYNHCWLMCDVVTGALVRSLQEIRLNPGTDFNVLFVSIDPNETWQLAARKRADYVRSYGRSKTGPGWHFLTGHAPEIAALTRAVGFHYYYDAPSKMFAHPSGIIVATPKGVVSKCLYGVEYDPVILRQSLIDAGGGTVGSPVEALLLLCYHWNPLNGKYGLLISRVMKGLCLGTAALLAGYITIWLRRDARRRQAETNRPIP
jgi:protein SCO1/2